MKQIQIGELVRIAKGERLQRQIEVNQFSEHAKEAQRSSLREYLSEKKTQLSADELCFLLNYVLGLPIVLGKFTIMAPAIPVMAVASWTVKSRKRIELWIEQEMRAAHMLPKAARSPGGRPSITPGELLHWIPGRRAA